MATHAPRRARFPVNALVAMPIALTLLVAIMLRWAPGIDLAAALQAFGDLPAWRLCTAVALTAASYLLLSCHDRLALAGLGEKASWPVILRATFTSYALTHNLGFSPLTGGSTRMLIYGRAGLGPATVARVVALAAAAFWCGIAVVSGAALLVQSHPVALFGVELSALTARIGGAALMGGLALVAIAGPRLRPVSGWSANLRIPLHRLDVVLPLIAVATIDIVLSALAFLVLTPSLGLADFPQLFLAYALGIVAGLVSHIPGGVGVFEGTVLAALHASDPSVAGALIAYRAIYYLLPLAAALVLNAVIELRNALRRAAALRRNAAAFAMETAPLAMAMLVFAGGLLLLLSGVLPGVHYRLRELRALVPLPVVEASHLGASLTGAALLIVAPALLSRSRAGHSAARALLIAGALCSLGKGLDFEEAGIMLTAACLLQALIPAFYRESIGAFSAHNRAWLLAAVAAVAGAAVCGLAAYPDVARGLGATFYFAWRADLSRYLRASFATCALVSAFAMRELLSRPPVLAGLPALPPDVFARATAGCGRTDAMLALTGDKRFLVSRKGDAFLMFRPVGRTWFVMGDPVGQQEQWQDLAWELRGASDRVGARLCFYQVSDAFLPLAVELGLRPIKYGEEAIVQCDAFTLAGARMKGLRGGHSRARREGLKLQILPAATVPAHLRVLREISDAWLARHGGREKRFSLGAFDPDYLAHCDIAMVLDGNGLPVAFANIWRSGDGAELSVDLMRQSAAAPPGTMDFLLIELAFMAGRLGYARFNLGVAPLSGMNGGRLAPNWARGANLAFGLRRISYNFRGLRQYKAKFAPLWRNRYIALPPGFASYCALFKLIRLIAR